MESLVTWVQSLPPLAYFAVVGLCAVGESFFPPIHNVVLAAALLAAAGKVNLGLSVAVITAGHCVGMAAIHVIVRRLGAQRLHDWVAKQGGSIQRGERRVHELYGRLGIPALFIARVLPGPRMVVAPITGALALPFVSSIVAMTLATPVMFGVLVAFRAGLSRWF